MALLERQSSSSDDEQSVSRYNIAPRYFSYHSNVSVLVCQLRPQRRKQALSTSRGLLQLHQLFCCLDELVDSFGCQKIRSTGYGAYMAVAGLGVPLQNHPQVLVDAAVAILTYITQVRPLRRAVSAPRAAVPSANTTLLCPLRSPSTLPTTSSWASTAGHVQQP